MSRAACVGLSLGLAACSPPSPPPPVAAPSSPIARPPTATATDCTEHPLVASTITCAAPPADVVARAQAELARVSLASSFDPELAWSCELARGWLVAATFAPVPAFHGDPVPCPPARGDCGVAATWLVPPRGALQRQPALAIAGNLDVDGDGHAETLTTDATGATTVWFDAGRTPVVVRAAGAPVPWRGGHVWLSLDGSPTLGFVRDTAVASRVTRAGVAPAPEIIAALWPTTVAARCPVAEVIAPGSAPPAAPPCPGDAWPVREAQLVEPIVARARARGLLLAEGPPDIQWACNRRAPSAVVTYCEGTTAGACADEHGTWVHEVWSGTHLLRRSTTGSAIGEWNITGTSAFVASVDLDGDGEPDQVLDDTSHEGGSSLTNHAFSVLVGGALRPLVSLSLRGEETSTWSTAPGAGHAQTLVLTEEHLALEENEPPIRSVRAWQLAGGQVVAVKRP